MDDAERECAPAQGVGNDIASGVRRRDAKHQEAERAPQRTLDSGRCREADKQDARACEAPSKAWAPPSRACPRAFSLK